MPSPASRSGSIADRHDRSTTSRAARSRRTGASCSAVTRVPSLPSTRGLAGPYGPWRRATPAAPPPRRAWPRANSSWPSPPDGICGHSLCPRLDAPGEGGGVDVTAALRDRLRAAASAALPPEIKRRLKRLVRDYHRVFRAFTPADLKSALLELGVVPGDVLMVHSAFDRFLGYQGGLVDAIRTLQEVVGERGTLMMPTIPFQGTAVEYALGDPVFDVQRTVSRMGLLTEVFRRSPGVVRSIHPTRSEEHTSELQSPDHLVCRLLLEKKNHRVLYVDQHTSVRR